MVRCVPAQSCLTLCDLMDCSLPGSSVHGIFQARILGWVAISFSKWWDRLSKREKSEWVSSKTNSFGPWGLKIILFGLMIFPLGPLRWQSHLQDPLGLGSYLHSSAGQWSCPLKQKQRQPFSLGLWWEWQPWWSLDYLWDPSFWYSAQLSSNIFQSCRI